MQWLKEYYCAKLHVRPASVTLKHLNNLVYSMHVMYILSLSLSLSVTYLSLPLPPPLFLALSRCRSLSLTVCTHVSHFCRWIWPNSSTSGLGFRVHTQL